MGICVSVTVEGEAESPVEPRTDGKPLADVAAGWIWFPEVVNLFRLSPLAVQALQLVDQTIYGGEAADVWQDPRRLPEALEELRQVVERIRANPGLIDEIDRASQGNATEYFDGERFDALDYDIEDSIATCDWAVAHGKRVALVAT